MSPTTNHLFGRELSEFCTDEGLVMSDVAFCNNDTYTYFSDSTESMSWIDHIVSTCSANNLIDNVWVDYSFISSDHHPLLCTINVDNVVSDDTVFNDVVHKSKVINGILCQV